jgi:hypothetical protein
MTDYTEIRSADDVKALDNDAFMEYAFAYLEFADRRLKEAGLSMSSLEADMMYEHIELIRSEQRRRETTAQKIDRIGAKIVFAISAIGFILAIAGLIYACFFANAKIGQVFLFVGATVFFGILTSAFVDKAFE